MELDGDGLAVQFDIRFDGQERGDEHLLGGVVQGKILIKGEFDFFIVKVGATVFGLGLYDFGRGDVFGASCRSHHIGATGQEQQSEKE